MRKLSNKRMFKAAQRRLITLVATAAACSSLLLLVPASVPWMNTAGAVSTMRFSLDSASDLSGGELEGTAVLSGGSVRVGVLGERTAFEGAGLARSIVAGPNGSFFVGTGNEGRIYRVRGTAEPELFAETGQLLVASMAIGGGQLYAGTIPEGRVFAIDVQSGEMRELARLENAEHIWALVLDGQHLYAGTGPEGKVFDINIRTGEAQVHLTTTEGHVLSLAQDGGALYAGTDGDALVYRVVGDDVTVVHDFPGNEITALAARDGVLAVVANDMPAPRRTLTTKAPTKATSRTRRSGKGRLYRVENERVERVYATDDEHFTAVALDAEGVAYVGSGKEGRVYRVAPNRDSAIWLDFDERQVLGLNLRGGQLTAVTGDSAALYQTRPAGAEGVWLSKVLDAGVRSRFGQLSWRSSGRLQLSTRTGNTEEPDETWSDWSQSIQSAGPVRSNAGRFIQIRAQLSGDAELRGIELYYLPQNRRARLGIPGLKAPAKKQARRQTSIVNLSWTVENPDDDELRYRLRYRQENQTQWRDVFGEEEELTSPNYAWNTRGIPDGLYVIEVSATDANANPRALALSDQRESEVILVDNHAPSVTLAVRGRTLRGSAEDSVGPLLSLEWSVDGGDYEPVLAEDGLIDERREGFTIDLQEIEAGPHIFSVRATDRGRHAVTAETTATLR